MLDHTDLELSLEREQRKFCQYSSAATSRFQVPGRRTVELRWPAEVRVQDITRKTRENMNDDERGYRRSGDTRRSSTSRPRDDAAASSICLTSHGHVTPDRSVVMIRYY